MEFRQARPGTLVTERMRDGSIAIFDQESKTSYFLNARAAAAWDACLDQADATTVASRMSATLKTEVSAEIALAALAELESKHLVQADPAESSDFAALAGRRRTLQTIGAAAGAVVLALTAGEQKAYAFQAASQAKGG